jgi:hypothetical protein
MGMRVWLVNGLVLGAMGWMASFAGMDVRAARVLPEQVAKAADHATLARLEARAAEAPTSVSDAVALAAAYLDRQQPGLASAVLEKAPREVRQHAEVAHLYARALFHRGHAREALAVAREASDTCDSASCPAWLVAGTARQVAYFEQVVAAGIDDPENDPEATRAALRRSAHQVRLVAMR